MRMDTLDEVILFNSKQLHTSIPLEKALVDTT